MKKRRSKSATRVNDKERQLKNWIAAEAARIFLTEKLNDIYGAKLKAAERIGTGDSACLPSNEEVESAIIEYQRLFSSDNQLLEIKNLQNKALAAMSFFEHFKPRIIGALVKGTASGTSTIYLHLFTDHAEEVDWFLCENKLPHEVFNKIYYINNHSKASSIPAYRFIAEETPVELSVFPEVVLRQQVRCSPKGQAIVRENLAKFKQLIST
jgi:hypothetical protein